MGTYIGSRLHSIYQVRGVERTPGASSFYPGSNCSPAREQGTAACRAALDRLEPDNIRFVLQNLVGILGTLPPKKGAASSILPSCRRISEGAVAAVNSPSG